VTFLISKQKGNRNKQKQEQKVRTRINNPSKLVTLSSFYIDIQFYNDYKKINTRKIYHVCKLFGILTIFRNEKSAYM